MIILIQDINECKIRNDDCDLNAVCENNEGSFSCECRGPLVYRSEKDCYYVNPCLMNPCDDFSTCTMDERPKKKGFSCPYKENDGQVNRIGDGHKSGPGCVMTYDSWGIMCDKEPWL